MTVKRGWPNRSGVIIVMRNGIGEISQTGFRAGKARSLNPQN